MNNENIVVDKEPPFLRHENTRIKFIWMTKECKELRQRNNLWYSFETIESPVAISTKSWFALHNLRNFTLHPLTTCMEACRAQRWAEGNKRIKKTLNKLTSGQFHLVHEVVRANDASHSTLLWRMNSRKWMAKMHKFQQIITILEENMLVKCITYLAIIEHLPKYVFIYKLAEEIQSLQ